MNTYKVIGVMSGTSLDGLDIAYCEFIKKRTWEYKIIYAETIRYSKEWKHQLSAAYDKNRNDLSDIDNEYGAFIANEVLQFIKRKKITPDFIASHGHTVLHQPDKGITLQIGSGNRMASICKIPVVCDFRSGDVALKGQGAPPVPLVDKLLFSNYHACLNLGGFANISFDNSRRKRIAFDICPVNIVLNELAGEIGKEFDKGGKSASKGRIDKGLLAALNALSFYSVQPPKSLGREWVERHFLPVMNSFDIPVLDKLRTVVEHIAVQIAHVVNRQFVRKDPQNRLLITGGGAYNDFLISRIASTATAGIILPDDKTIQFKEAMAFAFLGILKMRNEINILKSVTGAIRDSSGGRIYYPD